MYKINDYIVYKHDVCKIKNIKKNEINNDTYYVISPIDEESLIINTPIDNRMGYIRNLISLNEAKKLIDNIPNVELIDDFTEKNIENIYKNLINIGGHNELIKIIKTTYIRNNKRINEKKKISEKDDKYFNLAEKYLYNELSIVFEMSFDEIKNYIINRVTEITK